MYKSVLIAAMAALAIAFSPCAHAAEKHPQTLEQKAAKAPLRDEKGRFVAAPKAEAHKAPSIQKASEANAPLRDEKGRFASAPKAEAPKAPSMQKAPEAKAPRQMPQRDEKGRFVSSKTPEKSAVMVSAKKGSDVFHKPGCRYFDAKAEQVFASPRDAEKAGLRPCKVCGK